MRQALEMALEALEKIAMVNAMDYEYQQWAKEYLAAIKEALAQPEQIQPDKVCIEDDGCPTEKAVLQRFWREYQKTQPEQEPVACIGYWNQKTGAYYKPDQISAAHKKLIDDGILRRCYTTPPQRKPLTDEGIREVLLDFPKHIGEWYDRDFVRFIRAIEAAHGIKE